MSLGSYRPRDPESTPFFQCLEDYLGRVQGELPIFSMPPPEYGPLRSVVEKTVQRFLECGLLRHGFARLKCAQCPHQAVLAFSCKTRCFCPSCQAKQAAAFLEQALEEVLEEVDHRLLVWTISRVLRPAFYKDRKLLGELCRCAWTSLRGLRPKPLGARLCCRGYPHHPDLGRALATSRSPPWSRQRHGLESAREWGLDRRLRLLFTQPPVPTPGLGDDGGPAPTEP